MLLLPGLRFLVQDDVNSVRFVIIDQVDYGARRNGVDTVLGIFTDPGDADVIDAGIRLHYAAASSEVPQVVGYGRNHSVIPLGRSDVPE